MKLHTYVYYEFLTYFERASNTLKMGYPSVQPYI